MQWVLPRQPLLVTVFPFLSTHVKSPLVLFFPYPFLSGSLSNWLPFSVLVHWVMWLFVFSDEAQSLVIGWYHSRSTLYIYVGNTNRRTDEQMEIEREGETDAERFVTLLRLHAVQSTHLFPLNCSTFLETINCYLWQKCHSVLGLHISRSSGSAGGFPFRAFHILD